MRSKLAARVLATALLAATLNVPAQAAPAAWWDWLERLPQRVLMGWQSKQGPGADPNGLNGRAGSGADPNGQGSGADPNGFQSKQGMGADPNGLTRPAPTANPGGGSSDAGLGVDPNG